MSSPYYLAIPGQFKIVGKQPDGDSVRFVTEQTNLFGELYRSYRLSPSKDGSVQLRLEGIDAPELHYGKYEQPVGAQSRDYFLNLLGFQNVSYLNPESATVSSSEPESVAGAILCKQVEANGRPVSYVILEKDFQALNIVAGEWNYISGRVLEATLNFQMLIAGFAYYIAYSSQPKSHQRKFKEAAQEAFKTNLGVWQLDRSREFTLENYESIGREGQLIFPKLFRRATDYLKDLNKENFKGDLKDWLLSKTGENDRLVLNDQVELSLSDLIVQRNNCVLFQADLLDIVFLEK